MNIRGHPIQNDVQLKVSIDALRGFEQALGAIKIPPVDIHPILLQARIDSVSGTIEELRESIQKYEDYKSILESKN